MSSNWVSASRSLRCCNRSSTELTEGYSNMTRIRKRKICMNVHMYGRSHSNEFFTSKLSRRVVTRFYKRSHWPKPNTYSTCFPPYKGIKFSIRTIIFLLHKNTRFAFANQNLQSMWSFPTPAIVALQHFWCINVIQWLTLLRGNIIWRNIRSWAFGFRARRAKHFIRLG